jgi:hypothetical protein
MAASAGINYRETYFEFPELTKVHGEPNSESLYKLRNELKANAQAVYSNLSDGAHGHLALVITDAQYALLTNQPFVRPVHPGALAIAAGTTGPMVATIKDAHNEQLRLFREVEGVEKALVQQIVKAIEPTYLASLRDRNSNSLRGTVNTILAHLQTTYGRISPQMMENREHSLRTMVYNPKFPIDTIFNAVEDFSDYAELAQQPITVHQTIAKAYLLLNKTGRFKQAITEWNRKPALDKTWPNFKTHFRQAHQEFRETTDISLEESELARNNANLVQQVVDGLQSALTPDDTLQNESAELIAQMANSATRSNETQQQLAAQLAHLQQAMALLQSQVRQQQQPAPYHPPFQPNYPPPQGGQFQPHGGQFQPQFPPRGGRATFGSQGRGARGSGNRGRGNQTRQRNTSLYCWTHGGCGHLGAQCNTKLPGHQDAATFHNKMGGNTHQCT